MDHNNGLYIKLYYYYDPLSLVETSLSSLILARYNVIFLTYIIINI